MKTHRHHEKSRKQNNADYVAGLNGKARATPQPFQLKGAEKAAEGKHLRDQADQQLVQQDYETLSLEKQYHYQLVLADYQPDKVKGHDEFKPGGFRYNHSQAYNYKIWQQLGRSDMVRARQIGDHWADPSTKAGNIMINNHQRQSTPMHIMSGNTYKPSKDLIYQQNAEYLGEAGVKQMAVDQLRYCQRVRKAIQLKINDPCSSEKEKNTYLAKDAKLLLGVNHLLGRIGELTEQQVPQVDDRQEAGFAIPVSGVFASLGAAIMIGTALYALASAIYGFVHETLEEVVDATIDDLLRDTGVVKSKEDPKPDPSKAPKLVPPNNGEKEDDDKPLKWDHTKPIKAVLANKGIVGALDENKIQKAKYIDHSWHAHHPWPKFMGGESDQPLMGIKGYIHRSVIHPLLNTFLKAKGYKVAANRSPLEAPNIDFIEKLRNDPVFKAKVMLDLMKFYADLNLITNPKIPTDAYYLGIKYSFDNLN